MQTNNPNQDEIMAKLNELKNIEMHGDPHNDLFEETTEEVPIITESQASEDIPQPQQKYYDTEQLVVAMWAETINNILIDCPMSEYKQLRLVAMRNKMLYEMDLAELIPPQPQVQEEVMEEVKDPEPIEDPEIDTIVKSRTNRDTSGDKDLDIISQKLQDINKKGGLMAPEEPEPEPTGIQKFMGGLGMGKKKQVVERTVSEEHQTTSMG